MQPDYQPTEPQPAPTPTVDVASAQKAYKRKTIWGIICLVGPTALIIISLLIYAVLGFIFGSVQDSGSISGGSLYPEPSPLKSIGNILLFLVGGISAITWLPGVIIGIVLLATRKKV